MNTNCIVERIRYTLTHMFAFTKGLLLVKFLASDQHEMALKHLAKVIGSMFRYMILNKNDLTTPHETYADTKEVFKTTDIWTIISVMFGIMHFICTLDWSVHLFPFTSIWQTDTFYPKHFFSVLALRHFLWCS